jgi:hypothetical protein
MASAYKRGTERNRSIPLLKNGFLCHVKSLVNPVYEYCMPLPVTRQVKAQVAVRCPPSDQPSMYYLHDMRSAGSAFLTKQMLFSMQQGKHQSQLQFAATHSPALAPRLNSKVRYGTVHARCAIENPCMASRDTNKILRFASITKLVHNLKLKELNRWPYKNARFTKWLGMNNRLAAITQSRLPPQ